MSCIRLVFVIFLALGAPPAAARTTIPVSSADWILEGDRVGGEAAPAGDVNGDG